MTEKYELDVDGLRREIVGKWVREKHQRLAHYVGISRGVRQGWIAPGKAGATYVDLFSGPGRSRIKDTDTVVDGSALVAWKTSMAGGAPFSKIIIADKEPENIAAAERRLRECGAPVECEIGPASDTIDRVVKRLDPFALHVVLLDPYGLRALPFSVIEKIANLRYVDIIIHVSTQGLQRNLWQALQSNDSSLDVFAPGWRVGLNQNTSDDKAIRHHFWTHWRNLIKGCNLTTAEYAELVTGLNNQPLYWLAFAARHERALEFWEKIRNIGKQGSFQF